LIFLCGWVGGLIALGSAGVFLVGVQQFL